MPLLADETLRRTTIDAFVKALRAEADPWRQARLLAFVRKRREHEGLRDVARELFEREAAAPVEDRRCYWAALEILTEPSPQPPAKSPLWIEPTSDVCFVRVPAGSFRSGFAFVSRSWEVQENEVKIAEFWLGRHPVTNGEYARYLEAAEEAKEPDQGRSTQMYQSYLTGTLVPRREAPWPDSRFSAALQPVVGVSWVGAAERFCDWLQVQAHARQVFSLPTKAQWEYACKAIPYGVFNLSYAEDRLGEFASYDGNSVRSNSGGQEGPHPVGLKKPNVWGLCDMLGNVEEWCQDVYREYYSPMDCEYVACGGSWTHPSGCCGSASFDGHSPDSRLPYLGFRLVAAPPSR